MNKFVHVVRTTSGGSIIPGGKGSSQTEHSIHRQWCVCWRAGWSM